MKLNWKALVALAVIALVLFWAVDSVRSRSYSGTNLNFRISSGAVMLTNPSSEPVPVQLVGTGTRSFTVSGTMDSISGSSTRQGTGRDTTQLFEFQAPPGVSEFSVARGTNVSLVANSETNLVAAVQSSTESESRTIIIVAAVVVLGALFYISRINSHRWFGPMRRRADAKDAAELLAKETAAQHGQGREMRAYGDNRA
jgi:hypothetical protein